MMEAVDAVCKRGHITKW